MTDTAERAGHTPGPWTIVPAPEGDDINIAAPHPVDREHLAKAHPNGFAVACAWALWERDGGCHAQIANASLIAAAPMLFDFAAAPALARILKFARGAASAHKNVVAIELIDGLEALRAAAISKVEGRSNG